MSSLQLPAGAIAVTGVCSALGRRLTRRLHRGGRVVGIDERGFPDRPRDVVHHRVEFWRKRVRDALRREPIGAVVHLVGYHDDRSDSLDRARNIGGFKLLLDHVRELGIHKLVLMSTAALYGPRPDNPQLLGEDAPLLGSSTSASRRGLTELDMLAQSFLWKHPDVDTVILRPVNILGPMDNASSSYFRLSPVPTVLGFDPMVQLLHVDDVVDAILLALRPGVRGVFNLAGAPPVALSKALARLGRSTLPLPYAVARAALDGAHRLGLAAALGTDVEHLRYVCMVDDQRARQVLGYRPRFDLDQTLRAVDEEGWP